MTRALNIKMVLSGAVSQYISVCCFDVARSLCSTYLRKILPCTQFTRWSHCHLLQTTFFHRTISVCLWHLNELNHICEIRVHKFCNPVVLLNEQTCQEQRNDLLKFIQFFISRPGM